MPAPAPSTGAVARADIEGRIELQRLAREIADEVARSDIEGDCTFEQIRNFTWYDTASLTDDDPHTRLVIDRALRYLDLRGRVVRHPQLKHLVRFER